jgi:hypothetical protein
MLLDGEGRDQSTLGGADKVYPAGLALLGSKYVREIQDVSFTLKHGQAGLAVAVGGERKAKPRDEVVDTSAADTELRLRDVNGRSGILEAVGPNHQHAVVVGWCGHADPVDRSAALDAIRITGCLGTGPRSDEQQKRERERAQTNQACKCFRSCRVSVWRHNFEIRQACGTVSLSSTVIARSRTMTSHLTLRLVVFVIALAAGVSRPALADGFISPFVGFIGGDCANIANCQDKKVDAGISIGTWEASPASRKNWPTRKTSSAVRQASIRASSR